MISAVAKQPKLLKHNKQLMSILKVMLEVKSRRSPLLCRTPAECLRRGEKGPGVGIDSYRSLLPEGDKEGPDSLVLGETLAPSVPRPVGEGTSAAQHAQVRCLSIPLALVSVFRLPVLAGEGRCGGVKDYLEHPFEIPEYLVVPETEHADASGLKIE